MDQLSREQVESLYFDTNEVVRRTILVHDAIQRARIEVLEQDLNDKEKAINEVQQTAREICKDLDDRIATLTAERDRLREDAAKDKESFYRRVAHEIDRAMERVKVRSVIARGEAYDEQLQIVDSYDGVIIVRMTSAALRGEGG